MGHDWRVKTGFILLLCILVNSIPIPTAMGTVVSPIVVGPVLPSSVTVPVQTTSVTGYSTVSEFSVTPSITTVEGTTTLSTSVISPTTTTVMGASTISSTVMSPSTATVAGVATDPITPQLQEVTPSTQIVPPSTVEVTPIVGTVNVMETEQVAPFTTSQAMPIVGTTTVTPDFSITASPTLLTIQQGDSDTSVITVTSINSFDQPVQLTVSGAPSEVTTTLNLEQVTPPPDGSTTSTLTVSVDITATLGSYILTVTGTSGTLTHSIDVTLEITATEKPPKFLTLPFNDPDIKIQQGWVYTFDPDPNAHQGVDFIKGTIDQSATWQSFDVVAAADGVAMQSSGGGYGTFVYIWHSEKDSAGSNYFTLYVHLDSVAAGIVSKPRGDTNNATWTPVKRGEIIGRAGTTGVADPSWVHLHFEVQRGGYPHGKTDPYDLYKTRDFYPGGDNYSGSGPNYLWITDPPTLALNQPPTCSIKLQKDGVGIDEIDVGKFFDIYVGDSTDDTDIEQVRFSSDDAQDGNPTGEWTDWYDWDNSLGDWDASTKIKHWAFATGGDKEVWAEVKDDIGQTDRGYANISVRHILPVPYYYQGVTDWCVPTSMSMIFKYYGQNIHSWDIAKDWGWSRDVQWTKFLEPSPAMVYEYFNTNGLATPVEDEPVDFDTIKAWIDARAPVLVQVSWWELEWPPRIVHAVVIVGYDISDGTEKVYINDPSNRLVVDKMQIPVSDPYVAVPVPWNDVVEYVDWAMAVKGNSQPPKGTIDVRDHEISFSSTWGMIDIWLYGLDKGLIWKNSPYDVPTLSPKNQFLFYGTIVNHMKDDQMYKLEIEFAGGTLESGIRLTEIWLTVSVEGHGYNNTIKVGPTPLKNLLIEYGQYTITLRLWDEDKKLMYDEVVLPSIEYSPVLTFSLGSPADLYVTDPRGLHVGVDPSTGELVNEIPGAIYTGPGSEPQVIAIPNPLDGNYTVLLIGTATDTYSLNAELIALQETTFVAVDIPISANAFHQYTIDWNALSLGEEGVIAMVDSDGDGMFEHTFTSDSELTQNEYVIATDKTPPETWLNIGEPKFVVEDITYLTSATPIVLIAEDDPGGSGVASTAYRIHNDTYDSDWITYTQLFYLIGLSDGTYSIVYNSTDNADNIELTNTATVTLDNTPPTTILTIGEPKYVTGTTFVTSETSFTLEAKDNTGSGVALIAYRIRNSTYDSSWIPYTAPFYLTALTDGSYTIEFNSTDNVGNVEPPNTVTVFLDNTEPLVAVVNPPAGWALQDGVTFIASTVDSSGVSSLTFSIREANDGEGVPVGFEDLPASYDPVTGEWSLFFDTLLVPDGYYVVLVKAEDNLGHIGSTIVPYSIRNWAVLELLPSTENNKAGRTMPVKFSLRVAALVDPNQPFVYNEELTIKIYATNKPAEILQESTFGDSARDYRIDSINELYITNFKTLKKQMQYTVSVNRGIFFIDNFDFKTVK